MKLLSHLVGTNNTQVKGLAAATDANDAVRLAQAQALIQALKDEILGGASGAYDTLQELETMLSDNESGLDALLTAIGAKVAKNGDTMTGELILSGDPTQNLGAAPKQYVDGEITSAINALKGGASGAYDTLQEIEALLSDNASGLDALLTAIGGKVAKSGDTMTGDLTLDADPTQNLHAATKQYVDSAVANAGTPGRFATTFTGNGTKTTETYEHELGSGDLVVQVKEISTGQVVAVDVTHVDSNGDPGATHIKIDFVTAPVNGKTYRVIAKY